MASLFSSIGINEEETRSDGHYPLEEFQSAFLAPVHPFWQQGQVKPAARFTKEDQNAKSKMTYTDIACPGQEWRKKSAKTISSPSALEAASGNLHEKRKVSAKGLKKKNAKRGVKQDNNFLKMELGPEVLFRAN